jgi:hypothetical protein
VSVAVIASDARRNVPTMSTLMFAVQKVGWLASDRLDHQRPSTLPGLLRGPIRPYNVSMPAERDELILVRDIRALVNALGVIVAGGRAVTAPALPAVTFPALASENSLDPRLRRWFVGGVLALLGAVTLVSTDDYLARRRALERWQKRCDLIGYPHCGSSPSYTIWEQKQGMPRPY